MREIEFTPVAEHQLSRLPRSVQARFAKQLPRLQEDPMRPRAGLDVKPLRAHREWRLRIGHYRAIYGVDEHSIVFLRFGHRSTVYR